MATAATEYEDRQMSIGRVFERAFSTTAHNPLVVLGIALVLGAIPSVIMSYIGGTIRADVGGSGPNFAAIWGTTVISWVVGIIIGAIVQGALTRATVAENEGHRATFAECVIAGARVFLPLIGVALIFGLGILFGSILLVVPGIIVMVMWSVAAPAVVVERDGVLMAISRSQELTKGARWKIFGLFLILLVIYLLLFSLLGLVGLSVMTVRSAGTLSAANLVATVVSAMLFNLLWGTIQPSLYLELRQWKEGGSLNNLEQVFA